MTLEDLEQKLATIEHADSPEARGLRAFIQLAKRLPPGRSVMGKIQRSFVDLATRERIAKARTFDELAKAIGPGYRVSIES